MTTPQDRGWGDPGAEGSAAATKYRKDLIALCEAGGVKFYVRTELRYLFAGFLNDLAKVHKFDKGALDDWGYCNRDMRGKPGRKSVHSWGLALDIDAAKNPMHRDGKLVTNLPVAQMRALCKKWGLSWGGDWKDPVDPMHVQFDGKPSDVKKYPLAPVKKAA